jgi:hypothetical protein
MSDSKTDNGISPELLKAAREAGVACLDTYRQLVEEAAETVREGVQGYWVKEYRPFIGPLYKVLRISWDPIVRCWPKLLLEDATKCCDKIDINWRTITPPKIWLALRNVFWNMVWNTKYRGPVSCTWLAWCESVVEPETVAWEPYVAVAATVVWQHIRTAIDYFSRPDSWDDAKAAIVSLRQA